MPLSILIAEDEPVARRLLQLALRQLGYDSLVARDGEEAWALWQRAQPDVIISDWVMPGLEGPDLCRRIRALGGSPYTYFILLTALNEREFALQGMRAGADDYLLKPLDLNDLQVRLIGAERVVALHRQIGQTLARREALLRFARQFVSDSDTERLLDTLLDEALRVTGGDGATVYRWDEQREVLASVRESQSTIGAQAVVSFGQGVVGAAVARRAPVVADAAHPDEPIEPALLRAGVQAVLAVPLLDEGRVVGALRVVGYRQHTRFSREDAESLELLAGFAATSLSRLEDSERMRFLAETDPLTGLANRRKAEDVLSRYYQLAQRHKQPFCVAFLDLDHFKQVNDQYGHATGDLVLRRLGQLLGGHFRGEDIVGRWGGEEFVVGMLGSASDGGVRRLSEALHALYAEPIRAADGQMLRVTFSGGVAELPRDATSLEGLYAAADASLYRAKLAGRARVFAADPGCSAAVLTPLPHPELASPDALAASGSA